MRFDELVVRVGDDEARLKFHPRLTVLGPMAAAERTQLTDTLLAGIGGTRDEVALHFVDGQGRPSTATSEGVIGADGVDLPDGLGELTRDHDRLRRLVVVTAPDLDLPAGRPDPGLLAQLAAARASLATLEEREQPAPVEPAVAAELAQLDDRLRDAADAEDRARHHRAALRLAELTRELEVIADLDATAEDDDALLAAATELTELAQRHASANVVAEKARGAVRAAGAMLAEGAGPNATLVSLTDDDQDPVTGPFTAAAQAWQRSLARVRSLEIALSNHTSTAMEGELDRRIPLLAPLDQDQLWAAHRRVRQADGSFLAVTAAREADADEIPRDVEADIDAAHTERVRTEEVAADRWRPGILTSSFLAVTGLIMATTNVPLALALFLGTFVSAAVMIVLPRRAVSAAFAEESRQLLRVGATSYLGLHLRRLDEPENDIAQQQLAALARERTLAMVAWKELVGHLDPADADGMEADIRGHALRFNAALRAERTGSLESDLAQARADRDEARDTVHRCADQLQTTLEQAQAEATEAGGRRAALAAQLGLTEAGGNEELAARRVTALQRQRVREATRPRRVVEDERDEEAALVAQLDRPGWDGPPPAVPSAAAVSLLRRRRDELRSRHGLPLDDGEALSLDRAVIEARISELESQVGETAAARDTMPKRLLAILARARNVGDGVNTESLPVILDDPLVRVAVDRRCDLLDMLLRVSERTQVVYVTDDPVVISWSRQQQASDGLLLLEPVAESA